MDLIGWMTNQLCQYHLINVGISEVTSLISSIISHFFKLDEAPKRGADCSVGRKLGCNQLVLSLMLVSTLVTRACVWPEILTGISHVKKLKRVTYFVSMRQKQSTCHSSGWNSEMMGQPIVSTPTETMKTSLFSKSMHTINLSIRLNHCNRILHNKI